MIFVWVLAKLEGFLLNWNRGLSHGWIHAVEEVVAVGLGQQVGVDFRNKELSVHVLVFAFVFVVILLFDLRDLSFNLSGLSFCTHPKM